MLQVSRSSMEEMPRKSDSQFIKVFYLSIHCNEMTISFLTVAPLLIDSKHV